MITQVFYQNFKGYTHRWDLEALTLVTGHNGAGKSTIAHAVQLLLLGEVPGHNVNNTVGDQFRAYCNADAGEMIIEVTTDRGSLRRSWSKSKGKVSTQASFNGADIPAKSDFSELLGIKIFDITGFWSLTPSQQVDVLCQMADVDPKELTRITNELEQVNTEKRKKIDLQKEAKEALKDHEKEMQELNKVAQESGIDVSESEEQVKNLRLRIDQIGVEIQQSLEVKSRYTMLEEKKTSLSKGMFEKGEELSSIHIPDEELESPKDLKRELADLDEARHAHEVRERHEQRVNRLLAIPQPAPPAYKEEDIQALTEKIVLAEQGGGIDKDAFTRYEVANSIFRAVQGIEYPDEDTKAMVVAQVKSICLGYKADKEKAEQATPLDQVFQMRKELDHMKSLREEYTMKHSEWVMGRKEAGEISAELEKMAVPHFNEDHYNKVRNKVASLEQDAESLRILKDRQERIKGEMDSMLAELTSIEEELSNQEKPANVEALNEERENLQNLLEPLLGGITAQVEYNKVKELADKREASSIDLGKKIASLKDEESSLQKKKADLLAKIQDHVGRKAGSIIYPCQVSMELPATRKNTDRIKFFRHEPSGKKVERGTLSGGEQIEFDLALGSVLVEGSGGMVCSEVAELTEDRMDDLVATLCNLGNADEDMPQQMLMGHSLERFKENDSVQYLNVDVANEMNDVFGEIAV